MLRRIMCGLGKKNNTVIRLPKNGMLVTITHNDPDVCEVADKTCFIQAREQSVAKKHILQISSWAKIAMPNESSLIRKVTLFLCG